MTSRNATTPGPIRRRIVLVSGAPGAGKTTLAVPLARRLELPLFCKDFIKQTLIESLGDGNTDLLSSRRFGGASMEILWSLASHAPSAVLEANFRPQSAYEREKLRSLDADIVEVHCECGSEETRRRFAARASEPGRHAAHPLKILSTDALAEYIEPLGVGIVVKVDTRAPVDSEKVAVAVLTAWSHSDRT